METTVTNEERSMLRAVAMWTRGVTPDMTNEEVSLCETLETRGFLSPVGAWASAWPWRLTDAGRAAAL